MKFGDAGCSGSEAPELEDQLELAFDGIEDEGRF